MSDVGASQISQFEQVKFTCKLPLSFDVASGSVEISAGDLFDDTSYDKEVDLMSLVQ